MKRHSVEFASGGLTLRGRLHVPEEPPPYAAVVVTHGFGAVKEMFGDHDYPAVFAAGGLAVLVYDHPHTGASDGEPRQELDPVAQQRAYQDAITYLSGRDDVGADQIGIWGTSYSGGHVLAVAATDRRVRCVVSQVMTTSGSMNLVRRHAPAQISVARAGWAEDRLARMRGEPPALVTAAPEGETAETDKTRAFFDSIAPEYKETFRYEVTLRSLEWYYGYEPAAAIEHISPTPLLMIVCDQDSRTPTEDALAAFARAREPKRLLLLEGDHYAAYREHFEASSTAALDWFKSHLRPR
jgi:uncharacterized protein